jgi:hypothetical protein
MNAEDGFWGGLGLEEALRIARLFAASGCVDAIVPSYGFTSVGGVLVCLTNVSGVRDVLATDGSQTFDADHF